MFPMSLCPRSHGGGRCAALHSRRLLRHINAVSGLRNFARDYWLDLGCNLTSALRRFEVSRAATEPSPPAPVLSRTLNYVNRWLGEALQTLQLHETDSRSLFQHAVRAIDARTDFLTNYTSKSRLVRASVHSHSVLALVHILLLGSHLSCSVLHLDSLWSSCSIGSRLIMSVAAVSILLTLGGVSPQPSH